MKKSVLCFVFILGALIASCASGSSSIANSTVSIPPVSTAPATLIGTQPVAQATSRGDKLEASSVSSVKIGDGRPVLVEFFRFT